MKIGIVIRDASEASAIGAWVLALTRSASARGWEIHVISERASAGRIAAAGGQTHLTVPGRWGGAFGLWVFARRARRELKAEPLELVVGSAECPDPHILLVPAPPEPGTAGKALRRAFKRARFRLAVVGDDAAAQVLQESFGVPRERIAVAPPPPPGASEREWANRAEAFWMAVA